VRCTLLLVAAPAPQMFPTWLMISATLLAALAPFAMDDVTCPQLATPAINTRNDRCGPYRTSSACRVGVRVQPLYR
jgi:hypothetical protein